MVSNNEKFICKGKYKVLEKIGEGAFGKVYLVEDNRNQKYAAKEISKLLDKGKLNYLKTEIEIMKKFDNINIIKLYTNIEEEHFFYLIMEYCNGKDLKQYITENNQGLQLPDKFYKIILRQLAEGMKYYKSKNIIHRDLKLENIMICFDDYKNPQIKIIDFGISKLKEDENEMAESLVGSPVNMDPRILKGFINNTKLEYGFEVDIWGFGVLSYYLLFGNNMPFPSKSKIELDEKYKIGTYLIPIIRSLEAVDFIHSILQSNLKLRLTIDKILEHPFLSTTTETKIDTEELKSYIFYKAIKLNIHQKIDLLVKEKKIVEIKEITEKISEIDINNNKNEKTNNNIQKKITKSSSTTNENIVKSDNKNLNIIYLNNQRDNKAEGKQGFSNSLPENNEVKYKIEKRYSLTNNQVQEGNNNFQALPFDSNQIKKIKSHNEEKNVNKNYGINSYENRYESLNQNKFKPEGPNLYSNFIQNQNQNQNQIFQKNIVNEQTKPSSNPQYYNQIKNNNNISNDQRISTFQNINNQQNFNEYGKNFSNPLINLNQIINYQGLNQIQNNQFDNKNNKLLNQINQITPNNNVNYCNYNNNVVQQNNIQINNVIQPISKNSNPQIQKHFNMNNYNNNNIFPQNNQNNQNYKSNSNVQGNPYNLNK